MNNFYDCTNPIFQKELVSVRDFPQLGWRWREDIPILSGIYEFCASREDLVLCGKFKLQFSFPRDYPLHIPTVTELDGQISANYHRNPDKSLCLGTPLDLYSVFAKERTLSHFIKQILNPYLFRWVYFSENKKELWKDRPHGNTGVFQTYAKALGVSDFRLVKRLLAIAVLGCDDHNQLCPCGSGMRMQDCHWRALVEINRILPTDIIAKDLLR